MWNFIKQICLACIFILTGCQARLTHEEIIKTFLKDLRANNYEKCKNSIYSGKSSTNAKLTKAMLQIRAFGEYLKTRPSLSFENFSSSKTQVTSTVNYTDYIFTEMNSEVTYVVRFSFANFTSNRVYDFRFYTVQAYDSLEQKSNVDLSKEQLRQLQELTPTLGK